MSKSKKLKIGNKLIEMGKVYRIFKIDKKEVDGKKERIIHFKPLFKDASNNSLVCSIPESSIKNTNLRKLVSKDEVKKVLKKLSKRPKRTEPVDSNEAKEILKLNNIRKTARLLKKYWVEKNNENGNFTKGKKDILEEALRCMSEEIASVYKISLKSAENKVNSALQDR